jgi:hypothetical protein
MCTNSERSEKENRLLFRSEILCVKCNLAMEALVSASTGKWVKVRKGASNEFNKAAEKQ